MKKILTKSSLILASLVMIMGVGAGISNIDNVNASHRHYHYIHRRHVRHHRRRYRRHVKRYYRWDGIYHHYEHRKHVYEANDAPDYKRIKRQHHTNRIIKEYHGSRWGEPNRRAANEQFYVEMFNYAHHSRKSYYQYRRTLNLYHYHISNYGIHYLRYLWRVSGHK